MERARRMPRTPSLASPNFHRSGGRQGDVQVDRAQFGVAAEGHDAFLFQELGSIERAPGHLRADDTGLAAFCFP